MRRATWFFLIGAVLRAQDPQPQEPVQGIAGLFATYRIVMLGEIHECRQQYDVLSRLSRIRPSASG